MNQILKAGKMFKRWRSRRKAKRESRQERRMQRVTMRNETRRITGGLAGAVKSIVPLLSGGDSNPAMEKSLSDGYEGETAGQSNMTWYLIIGAVALYMFKDKIFGR